MRIRIRATKSGTDPAIPTLISKSDQTVAVNFFTFCVELIRHTHLRIKNLYHYNESSEWPNRRGWYGFVCVTRTLKKTSWGYEIICLRLNSLLTKGTQILTGTMISSP